jgi:hypothetical protein
MLDTDRLHVRPEFDERPNLHLAGGTHARLRQEDKEVELRPGGPAVEVTTMRLLAQGKYPVGVIVWDEDDKPVLRETPEALRSRRSSEPGG